MTPILKFSLLGLGAASVGGGSYVCWSNRDSIKEFFWGSSGTGSGASGASGSSVISPTPHVPAGPGVPSQPQPQDATRRTGTGSAPTVEAGRSGTDQGNGTSGALPTPTSGDRDSGTPGNPGSNPTPLAPTGPVVPPQQPRQENADRGTVDTGTPSREPQGAAGSRTSGAPGNPGSSPTLPEPEVPGNGGGETANQPQNAARRTGDENTPTVEVGQSGTDRGNGTSGALPTPIGPQGATGSGASELRDSGTPGASPSDAVRTANSSPSGLQDAAGRVNGENATTGETGQSGTVQGPAAPDALPPVPAGSGETSEREGERSQVVDVRTGDRTSVTQPSSQRAVDTGTPSGEPGQPSEEHGADGRAREDSGSRAPGTSGPTVETPTAPGASQSDSGRTGSNPTPQAPAVTVVPSLPPQQEDADGGAGGQGQGSDGPAADAQNNGAGTPQESLEPSGPSGSPGSNQSPQAPTEGEGSRIPTEEPRSPSPSVQPGLPQAPQQNADRRDGGDLSNGVQLQQQVQDTQRTPESPVEATDSSQLRSSSDQSGESQSSVDGTNPVRTNIPREDQAGDSVPGTVGGGTPPSTPTAISTGGVETQTTDGASGQGGSPSLPSPEAPDTTVPAVETPSALPSTNERSQTADPNVPSSEGSPVIAPVAEESNPLDSGRGASHPGSEASGSENLDVQSTSSGTGKVQGGSGSPEAAGEGNGASGPDGAALPGIGGSGAQEPAGGVNGSNPSGLGGGGASSSEGTPSLPSNDSSDGTTLPGSGVPGTTGPAGGTGGTPTEVPNTDESSRTADSNAPSNGGTPAPALVPGGSTLQETAAPGAASLPVSGTPGTSGSNGAGNVDNSPSSGSSDGISGAGRSESGEQGSTGGGSASNPAGSDGRSSLPVRDNSGTGTENAAGGGGATGTPGPAGGTGDVQRGSESQNTAAGGNRANSPSSGSEGRATITVNEPSQSVPPVQQPSTTDAGLTGNSGLASGAGSGVVSQPGETPQAPSTGESGQADNGGSGAGGLGTATGQEAVVTAPGNTNDQSSREGQQRAEGVVGSNPTNPTPGTTGNQQCLFDNRNYDGEENKKKIKDFMTAKNISGYGIRIHEDSYPNAFKCAAEQVTNDELIGLIEYMQKQTNSFTAPSEGETRVWAFKKTGSVWTMEDDQGTIPAITAPSNTPSES